MQLFGSLRHVFWGICLGAVVLYAFFAAMGGFAPDDVAGLTVAVVVLGTLFAFHELRIRQDAQVHGREDLMRELHMDRERRGF